MTFALLADCRRDEVERYDHVDIVHEPVSRSPLSRTFRTYFDCRKGFFAERLVSDVGDTRVGRRHVAFTKRDRTDQLWLVDLATCEVTMVFEDPRIGRLDCSEWSPTGERFWLPLFQNDEGGRRGRQATVVVTTRPVTTAQVSDLAWMPIASSLDANGPATFNAAGTVLPVSAWLPDGGKTVAVWSVDGGFEVWSALRPPAHVELTWNGEVPVIKQCDDEGCRPIEPPPRVR